VKKLFAFALGVLLAGAAHADWVPRIQSGKYMTTFSGAIGSWSDSGTYSEDRFANGPLSALAGEMRAVPTTLQYRINSILQQEATAKGFTFLGGTLRGDLTMQVLPQSNGTVLLRLSGLSYDGYTRYTGSKYGITLECTNHASLANIVITAQYGTVDGSMPTDKIGLTANTSSSTDCDSNLSWILPILGDILLNVGEGYADRYVVDKIKETFTQVNSRLLFGRDENFVARLNRLFPINTKIGQYINNNLWQINNSHMTLQLGRGANLGPVYGTGEPHNYQLTGDFINLTISAPGLWLNGRLHEEVDVFWEWKCSVREPSRVCPQP